MSNWSSDKVPASDGLANVAVAGVFSVFENFGIDASGSKLAALLVAYVHSRKEEFDVSDQDLERLIEFVAAHVARRYPDFRNFSMSFIIDAALAMRKYARPGPVSVQEAFFDDYENWEVSRDDFLHLFERYRAASDSLIDSKRDEWLSGE